MIKIKMYTSFLKVSSMTIVPVREIQFPTKGSTVVHVFFFNLVG